MNFLLLWFLIKAENQDLSSCSSQNECLSATADEYLLNSELWVIAVWIIGSNLYQQEITY